MPNFALPNQSASERFLQLFALCGFAVAQPLFEILSRQTEFLVARGGDPDEIIAITLVLLIAPAMTIFLFESLVGLVSKLAARSIHGVAVLCLSVAIVLGFLVHRDGIGSGTSIAVSLGAGLIFTIFYARREVFRGLIRALSPGPIVLAGFFLTSDGIDALLNPGDARPGEGIVIASETPVVVILFDELPLSSLLATLGSISSEYYPHFADLAASSTWYRRAVATGSHTTIALPILLTGRYPALKPTLPIAAHHPENLFSLLGASYALEVVESVSLLHLPDPDEGKEAEAGQGEETPEFESLASDLALIYAHLIAPAQIRKGLPEISTTWGGFSPGRDPVPTIATPTGIDEAAQQKLYYQGDTSGPVAAVRRFRRAIKSSGRVPDRNGLRTLYFMHTSFPHAPWEYIPDGRRYAPVDEYTKRAARWVSKPWWPIDAYRRHLLQTGYADNLLGQVVQSLKTAGLYSEALIIVAADHGISFWPHSRVRVPERHPHVEDIINVPLFVKFPGQQQARVDSRIAESVDILPTIADVLDIEIPWSVDGCSLARDDCPSHEMLTTYLASNRQIVPRHYPPILLARSDTLSRKLSVVGGGPNSPSFYAFGPYAEWIGKSVESLQVRSEDLSGGTIELEPVVAKALNSPDGKGLPIRFSGNLLPELPGDTDAQIALAVDGIIASIVPAPKIRKQVGHRIAALLPPEVLDASNRSLRIYRFEGPVGEPTLHELRVESPD